jgi:hypothetical protein
LGQRRRLRTHQRRGERTCPFWTELRMPTERELFKKDTPISHIDSDDTRPL